MEEKKKIKINLKTAVIIIFFIVALICTVFLVSSFSLKTTTENNLVNVFRDTYQKHVIEKFCKTPVSQKIL